MRAIKFKHSLIGSCIVVGSSRGLGAALVNELLEDGGPLVVGVSRSPIEAVENHEKLAASSNYRHLVTDIGSRDSVAALRNVALDLAPEALLVIFNAACVVKDVREDTTIDFQVFEEVNRVCINGFSHILEAFESHLTGFSGILVAISSINAIKPPVFEHRVAYAPSKAYLDMIMRSLAFLWPNVNPVTVHLGKVGGNRGGLFQKLLKPTYQSTARRIVGILAKRNVPRELTYPIFYRIVFKYFLKFLPDSLYYKLSRYSPVN